MRFGKDIVAKKNTGGKKGKVWSGWSERGVVMVHNAVRVVLLLSLLLHPGKKRVRRKTPLSCAGGLGDCTRC